jgi:uncharacterized membrane protein
MGIVAAAIVPINGFLVYLNRNRSVGLVIFLAFALAQCLLGMLSGVLGLLHYNQRPHGSRGAVLALAIVGLLIGLGGLVPVFLVGALLLVGGLRG